MPDAVRAVMHVGAAIHYLHRCGWLYRDLKPGAFERYPAAVGVPLDQRHLGLVAVEPDGNANTRRLEEVEVQFHASSQQRRHPLGPLDADVDIVEVEPVFH